MAVDATSSLLEAVRKLQLSEEYSDLKIFCGDQVFKVHKAILCTRSNYFAVSCRWGKSADTKEEITLKEEDPRLICRMLDFIYQLDYNDLPTSQKEVKEPESPVAKAIKAFDAMGDDTVRRNSSLPVMEVVTGSRAEVERVEIEPRNDDLFSSVKSRKDKKKKRRSVPEKKILRNSDLDLDSERLTTNALMYSLAERFQIAELKVLAQYKFDQALVQDWDTAAFAHAADLVFRSTPSSDKGLRNIVAQTLKDHQELVDYEEIQKLLESDNGMAWAFVQVLLEQSKDDDPMRYFG